MGSNSFDSKTFEPVKLAMPVVHSGRTKSSVGVDPYFTTFIRKVNESHVRRRLEN